MSAWNARDLTGQTFGRLTVIEKAREKTRDGRVQWVCSCSCGTRPVIVRGHSLQSEDTRSCGCLSEEAVRARFTIHGHTNSRTHRSYLAAKGRCRNSNNVDFADYGGRGIEFRFKNFEQFLAELGERPEGKTLERIDNDGHYEIGNVTWATHQQQANNRRGNRRVTAFGRTRTIAWWSRESGVPARLIHQRIFHLGWPVESSLDRNRHGTDGFLGERNPKAKLTPDIVRRIRTEYRPGYGNKIKLCRQHGLSRDSLDDLLNRRSWRHVD
jgi:hypothetical protein